MPAAVSTLLLFQFIGEALVYTRTGRTAFAVGNVFPEIRFSSQEDLCGILWVRHITKCPVSVKQPSGSSLPISNQWAINWQSIEQEPTCNTAASGVE